MKRAVTTCCSRFHSVDLWSLKWPDTDACECQKLAIHQHQLRQASIFPEQMHWDAFRLEVGNTDHQLEMDCSITSRSTSCVAALQSQHITFSLITARICHHDLSLRSEWVLANIAKFANLFLLTLIRLNMIISNLYTFSIHIWTSLDGLILCEQHNYLNLNRRLARGSDAFNLSETKKEKKTDELSTILTYVSSHMYILFQISALELWWSYI